MQHPKTTFLAGGFLVAGVATVVLGGSPFSLTYDAENGNTNVYTQTEQKETEKEQSEPEDVYVAEHIDTPDAVRGVYMSQCAAATSSFRAHFINLIQNTELNSIIIDVKDFSGTLAFTSDHPLLQNNAGEGCRVRDFKEFVAQLHEEGVYVIGRITVFQDPFYTKQHPHLAVQSKNATGTLWADHKGLSFIDVGAEQFWEYIVAIGKESYRLGIDELNFDYIRYPSDGNMKDVRYTHSDGDNKAEELEYFFKYLAEQFEDSDAVLSADLFGMTATNVDHLNIGQQLERALPYFDYIAPMVYPSHYPSGFHGYQEVNKYPYEIIHYSMSTAVRRALASTTPVETLDNTRIGTSTPAIYTKPIYDSEKLRPWLQDFDYPVEYTPEMVRMQIQATYDAGLNSWMLWDPANRYTKEALKKAEEEGNL